MKMKIVSANTNFMNKKTLAKHILRVLSTQSFADWYGDGGDFDNFIRGERRCPSSAEILKHIKIVFLDGAPTPRAVAGPRRKTGEHSFADCGGNPRCVTCGCDEDDAFVGGEKCTFKALKR